MITAKDISNIFNKILSRVEFKKLTSQQVAELDWTKTWVHATREDAPAGQKDVLINLTVLRNTQEPSGKGSDSSGTPGAGTASQLDIDKDTMSVLTINPIITDLGGGVYSFGSIQCMLSIEGVIRAVTILTGTITVSAGSPPDGSWVIDITSGLIDGIIPILNGTLNLTTNDPVFPGNPTITVTASSFVIV